MLKNFKTGDNVGGSSRFGDVLFRVCCLGLKAIFSRQRGEFTIPASGIKECPATLIQKLEAIPESKILPKMKERLFHFLIRPNLSLQRDSSETPTTGSPNNGASRCQPIKVEDRVQIGAQLEQLQAL